MQSEAGKHATANIPAKVMTPTAAGTPKTA
jgi:hypothetical protein